MSVPKIPQLTGLDYAYYGLPFLKGASNENINLDTLDYAHYGLPFLSNPASATVTTITRNFTELVTILDSVTGHDGRVSDSLVLGEELVTKTTVYLTEYFNFADSVVSASSPSRTSHEYIASCAVRIKCPKEFTATTSVKVKARKNPIWGQSLVIRTADLVAVTSATSLSNPTLPAFVKDGIIQYENPANPVTNPENAICYTKLTCANLIGTKSATEITNWNMNIEEGGGRWTVGTVSSLGNFEDEIQIFGLKGTITKLGFDYPKNPYITGGIFGSRLLNKELLFLLHRNRYYITNSNSQKSGRPGVLDYKTHQDAARAIGSLAGVNITWAIRDFPKLNFTAQASQTGLQALSSIASEAGGVLRWNGGTNYTITYPNVSYGLWEVPECCLITAFAKECNLDLNTGYYSPGTYLIPQLNNYSGVSKNNYNDSTSSETPNGSASAKQIEEIYKTSVMKVIGESPTETVDLPSDFEDVYIQIVTGSDFQGRFVTSTPSRWFLLQTGFAGQYINNIDVAGVLKPVVKIDPSLFPQTNSDLTSGDSHKWYLKIGVTRKSISGGTSPANKVDEATTLAKTILRYKWIPTCTGTISAAYFGSIPLPGMTARATIGGQTIEGIIESVQFTSPAVVTVNVVNWTALKFYEQH